MHWWLQEYDHELCSLQITTLQLNESACKRPLVETDHQSSWYEGIEGCGIQCENPIFTSEEHTRIHRFVGAFGSLSFTCSLFTMVLLSILSLVSNSFPGSRSSFCPLEQEEGRSWEQACPCMRTLQAKIRNAKKYQIKFVFIDNVQNEGNYRQHYQ